jgi:hypothetical protein
MDRNPNDEQGTTPPARQSSEPVPPFREGSASFGAGAGGMSTGAAAGESFGHAGGVQGTTRESGYGREGSLDRSAGTSDTRDLKRKASEKLHEARDVASEKWSKARERAGDMRVGLADKLDAGADKLRSRSAASAGAGTFSGETAYASPDGASASASTQSKARTNLADGMHSTADWLRNNDLDTIKGGIESQVRNNPGRSLVVAAVAGYLIGKAFRRR